MFQTQMTARLAVAAAYEIAVLAYLARSDRATAEIAGHEITNAAMYMLNHKIINRAALSGMS